MAGGADALGVAGGDGSLAVVAAVALTHGVPFVCIPAGTRNHFALDVGVDRRDLVGALDAFTEGVERRIDVARVNGRLFLNNVSLGIYGDAVRRPEYRNAKVRTLLATTQAVLGPGRAVPGLCLVDDRGCEHRHPAVVVVSNNPYALHGPVVTGTGRRSRAVGSGSSSSIDPTTTCAAAVSPAGRGLRHHWRSTHPSPCTQGSMASPSSCTPRSSSPSCLRRYASGSRHAIPACRPRDGPRRDPSPAVGYALGGGRGLGAIQAGMLQGVGEHDAAPTASTTLSSAVVNLGAQAACRPPPAPPPLLPGAEHPTRLYAALHVVPVRPCGCRGRGRHRRRKHAAPDRHPARGRCRRSSRLRVSTACTIPPTSSPDPWPGQRLRWSP